MVLNFKGKFDQGTLLILIILLFLFADSLSASSFGKAFSDYDKCYEVLGAIVKFRCNKGCKNGGGTPFCKIRKCCEKKEWDTGIFEIQKILVKHERIS